MTCYRCSSFTTLTLGLLRGLEERPVDAPLTERDLTHNKGVKISSAEGYKYIQHGCICLERATVLAQGTFLDLCSNSNHVLFYFSEKLGLLYLWLCAAVSRALRGGVGDPCSVTLRTSRLFLSGRQRPWRVSIGESTRFRGGSAEEHHYKVITGASQNILTQQCLSLKCSCLFFVVTKI